MAVDIAIATESAISGVVSTLQTNLSGELTTRAVTGLPLDAPAAAAYYTYQPAIPQGLSLNHEIFCFVYQATPLEFTTYYTKSVSTGGSLTTIQIGVLLAFRVAMFTPFTRDGKTITSPEVMDLRGHRYNAGVIDAVLKNAREDSSILRVDLESVASSVNFDEDNRPVLGLSETIWTVVQDAEIPQPQ